jgi:pimeloyl-ACP methyl ester carboxylesterase
MSSDISAIRLVAQKLIEEEQKDVILVCHSAGGFLGSEAIEGLDAKGRSERGAIGGVRKIVFLAGGIAPAGQEHVYLPFCDLSKGVSTVPRSSSTF